MRIALLSTSDTDLLSAKASGADYVWANPSRPGHQSMATTIEGADLVVGRILGSPADLCSGFVRIKATGMPMVVLGGEQTPSAELMELSSVPVGIAAEAHQYLAEGGPANLAQLHAFLSDTVLLTGEGFDAPVQIPAWGVLERPAPAGHGTLGLDAAPQGALLDQRERSRVGGAVLPGARVEREQRLRARPVRRHRRDGGGGRRPDLLLQPALRPRRAVRRAGHAGRAGRHRPGRGGYDAQRRQRRRRRRGLGRTPDGRAGHPDRPGPVPDQQPGRVAGLGRGGDPARLGQPDRDPGVRRKDHHRAVQLQGDRPGRPRRAAPLRRRPRAVRPGGRDRGQPRPAAPDPDERAQDRADALGVPDQALPRRQRGGPGHPGQHDPAAAPDARRRLRPRSGRRGPRARRGRRHGRRRHAHPRPDRRRRPGRGVADQRPAHRRPRADHEGRLRPLDRRRARRPDGPHHRGLGRVARKAVRQR